jgi:hypothetical protein
MAVGMRIAAPVAEGVQLDWEAILRPSHEDFIESVSRTRQKIVHVSAGIFPTCPAPPPRSRHGCTLNERRSCWMRSGHSWLR